MPFDEALRQHLDAQHEALSTMLTDLRGKRVWDEIGCRLLGEGEELPAERIATWVPEIGAFRWGWATRHPRAPTRQRVDEAYREGHKLGLVEMVTEEVRLHEDWEARALAAAAGALSGASKVLVVGDGSRTLYLARFDTVLLPRPTPPPMRSPAPASPLMNPFPRRPRTQPPASPSVPAEEAAGLAEIAQNALDKILPRFREGLLIVTIDDAGTHLVLAAVDANGKLVARGVPDEVRRATISVLAAQATAGRVLARLTVRLMPGARGSSFEVDSE